MEARANLDMRLVFAAIAWLILIGFVFYFGVELLERLAVRGRKHRTACRNKRWSLKKVEKCK